NSTQSSPAHKPIPPPISTSINIGGSVNSTEKFKKSLRLTTDQIGLSSIMQNGYTRPHLLSHFDFDLYKQAITRDSCVFI
ncbi:unnamed protein product, partial [Allacma fusca]